MNLHFYYIIILFFSLLYSEPIYVFGKILDENGKGLKNVNIYSNDKSIGSYSSENGEFDIEISTERTYSLYFSHIGYNVENKNIQVKYKSVNLGNIELVRENIVIDEISISVATRKAISIKDSPILTHVITSEDIKNSSSTNVMELIESSMPNIQSLLDPHGTFKIKIQGFDNKDITFMQDGVKISGETFGNIDLSMLNINNIDQIEVIRGGMSTLYGSGAIGGVINIKSKVNRDKYTIKYQNNLESILNSRNINLSNTILNSNTLSFGIKNKHFSNDLNINYSYSDGYDLTPPSTQLSGRIDKTLDENLSYLFDNRTNLFFNKNLDVSLYLKWYLRRIFRYEKLSPAYSIIDNIPEDSLIVQRKTNPEYKDIAYNLKLNYLINDKTSMSLILRNETYFKGYRFPYYNGDYPTIFNESIMFSTIPNYKSVNATLNFSMSKHEISLGNELEIESTKSSVIYNKDSTEVMVTSIFNENKIKRTNNFSIFIFDRYKISKKLNIDFGLRYTIHEKKKIFLPSLFIKNNYADIIFRLNLSRNYRLPSVTELYYDFPGHSPPIYGNSNLKPQLSNNFSISIEHEKIKNSSLEYYENKNYNMIAYDYKDECQCYETDNYKEVKLYGINLNNSGSIKTFDIPIDYKIILSYTDSESIFNSPTEGISKYSLKSLFSYDLNEKVNINYSIKYLSKKIIFYERLESHFISDLTLNYSINQNIFLKLGVKNLANYKDSRISENSDLLTTYDPGRRLLLHINLKK